MRYFFRVEYDGTRYNGWQSQENAPSIQDALNAAFGTVVRYPCVVTGAEGAQALHDVLREAFYASEPHAVGEIVASRRLWDIAHSGTPAAPRAAAALAVIANRGWTFALAAEPGEAGEVARERLRRNQLWE